ncbi:MAG: MFS transporter [Dehalococcoidia bacterium]|nr:MFS transporter [Dehalococcoidia bacterium]
MATTAPAAAFVSGRNVRLLYAFWFLLSFQPWMGTWIAYLTDFRGVSLFLVGLLETFFQFVGLFARVPAGAFADRFGRRNSLALAMAIEGSGLFLFGLADSYPLILLSYVLWAGGSAFRDPVHAAYLYDALAAEGREGDFSKQFGRLSGFGMAGMLLGPLIGAPIAGLTTLQVPVLLSAVSYGSALVIALMLKEPPRRTSAAGGLSYLATMGRGVTELWRDRAAALVVVIAAGLAFAVASQMMLLQPFLQAYAVPVGWWGLLMVPARLGSVAGSTYSYQLQRVLGERRAFGLLIAIPVVLLVALAAVDHVVMVLAIGAISVVSMTREPIFTDYLSRRVGSEVRATVLAVRRLGIQFVLAFAAPLAGGLGERSLPLAFAVLAVLTAGLAVPAYILWLRVEREAGATREASSPERSLEAAPVHGAEGREGSP